MGCAGGAPREVPIPPVRQSLFAEHQGLLKQAGLRVLGGEEKFGWGKRGIAADDTLLVIDMQNDFIPADVAPQGGRFGVPEGGSCVRPIVMLIEEFASVGALVVATRDYHPYDHCSFNSHGGPFPAHCVQGSAGSFFHPGIAKALIAAEKVGKNAHRHSKTSFGAEGAGTEAFPRPNTSSRVEIVFKGFVEEVDSFGGFEYGEEWFKERVKHCEWKPKSPYECMTCAGPWTGCWSLKCSDIAENIDAPPDIMSIMRPDKKPLHEVIPKKGRLLIVGLAFDFCVTDSAVNARKLGYEQVFIGIEAVRAAHIPGVGEHGSGFLTPPQFLVDTFKSNNIGIISLQDVIGDKNVPGMYFAAPDHATE